MKWTSDKPTVTGWYFRRVLTGRTSRRSLPWTEKEVVARAIAAVRKEPA